MLLWQLLIVAALILLNGFFAMSELAIVSARKVRLERMAATGNRGAATALRLANDPTGFLSSVQIGITLVGIFAGAYGGTAFAEPLARHLAGVGVPATVASEIAFGLVVAGITYVSLIVGELVPKRLALGHAEAIASFAAAPMLFVSRLASPIVFFLRISTNLVLRLMRVRPREGSDVSEEEVKALIAEGARTGVFVPAERDMINAVLRLADRPVRSIMVPRTETVWLSLEDPVATVLEEIRASGHSRFPITRGGMDDLLGVVHAKDLIALPPHPSPDDIERVVKTPLYISENLPVLKLLDRFRGSSVHMAVVVDEYGAFEGVVTPNDILTAIAGDLPERPGDDAPEAVQRKDGSWLLDGRMPVDRLEGIIGIAVDPDASYVTVAGLMLERMERIPEAGESFVWQGWEFEVVDLDGRRIDKVLVQRAESRGDAGGGSPSCAPR
ncbi:hemolysin family protein [Lutibaculum baratangense]|uniref:Hemolysin n=1 Tax=Lutibaculum baratangense AMV1 TaxID=631454 RepID=V4REY0_9HYPH|nr:hemolysin family protein [Lutibaculum baratangense]ESR23909.1 Hemolysin [Lutibaculum baratangense AMV1]